MNREDFLALTEDDQAALVAAYFENTDIEKMSGPVTALAEAVYKYRVNHRGFVPPAVFEPLMGPVTVSVQTVHEVRGGDGELRGYALRKRDSEEVGEAYEGLFHNTCCGLRWLDTIEVALKRNDKDAFQGCFESPSEHLGFTYHHEAPRRNADLTFMYRRVISLEDIGRMNGEWRVFTVDEIVGDDPPIVESNIPQLQWVMEGESRPWFGVLLATYPEALAKAFESQEVRAMRRETHP